MEIIIKSIVENIIENTNEIIAATSVLILIAFICFYNRKSKKKDFYLATIYCHNCKHYLGKDIKKFRIKCKLLGSSTIDETSICQEYKYERKE